MTAPIKGELQPNICRCKLGGFEIVTFLDCKVLRSGLTPSFGGEAAAAEVRALAAANRIDADRYEHAFTPLLVNTGQALVLFDTGCATLLDEYESMRTRLPRGRLVELLAQAGYRPEDVDVVVITHGHPDHIGGLLTRGAPTYPNARHVFGAADFDFWIKGENVREARKSTRELYVTICTPLAERATFIKPGDEVVPGIRAVDAFGHSPGMLAFTIESEGKVLLNWADTCNHYVTMIARPDFVYDMDDDKEKAIATRKRLLDMAASEKLYVAGFHMPFPALGWIDRTSGGYRWVAVSYQMNL